VATSPETDTLDRAPRETLYHFYQDAADMGREKSRFPVTESALESCAYEGQVVSKL
jgi:hypothetical protein